MSHVRWLVDEDVDGDIPAGFRRRRPDVDVVRVQEAGLLGEPDPQVLAWAARENRVIISHDIRTMPRHAADRLAAGLPIAGLCVLLRRLSIGQAIETLVELAVTTDAESWRDRIRIMSR